MFRRSVEALVADERSKQHHVIAERLIKVLAQSGDGRPTPTRARSESSLPFLSEKMPERSLLDIKLRSDARRVVSDLVEEHGRSDLLRSYNLEPRHRLLLTGPPGNGKTTLAEAIAGELGLSLYTVRYEALIGSYLGETSSRIGELFDYVRSRPGVLFFDEFDVVGKERSDTNETGEVKRIVSTLLLQVDALPSYVVSVAATNHPELLDRAAWRRFEVVLDLPQPTPAEAREWVGELFERLGFPADVPHHNALRSLSGMSYSDIEQIALDAMRRFVLGSPMARENAGRLFTEAMKTRDARRGMLVKRDDTDNGQ